jgi:16S rRNA (adenine1518-N6/adenine1519-N6)-dimethyltransferase
MIPKKSLGQNFLRDKVVLDKIIQAADLSLGDLVLEVGPGEGILTAEIVKLAGKVIAIEIDRGLAENLKKKYSNNKKVEIINDDILKINLPELLETHRNESLLGENYKIIANIPYYITSPIIQLFLETQYPPTEMILMVQKEVAQRICALPGSMSILAVSVQYYAKPELIFYVDKESFWPIPEVDSAVIRVTHNLERKPREETNNFFRIVKAGFSARRKTLANNLSNSLHIKKSQAEDELEKAEVSPNARAQELSVEDWKKLANVF